MCQGNVRGTPIRSTVKPALLLLPAALCAVLAQAQPNDAPAHVLGRLSAKQFLASADSSWATGGIADYRPRAATADDLRLALADVDSVVVYYGSWCGDSRREVPRVLATLDAADYPRERLRLVGVDDADSTYKQSPDGATVGRHVYRVPTVTLHRDGAELGRLIELPCTTPEADLLAIATVADYTPNYPAFPYVDSLLAAGVVADENVTYYSLGKLLGPRLGGPVELANVSRVLQLEDREAEALQLARANVTVFREDAYAWANLARRYAAAGNYDSARRMTRNALRYVADEDEREELLDLLEAYVRAGA